LFPCYTSYKTTTNGKDRKQQPIKRQLLFVLYGKQVEKKNMTLYKAFVFTFMGGHLLKLLYFPLTLQYRLLQIVYGRFPCSTQDRQDKEKTYSTLFSNSFGTNATATINHVIRQGQGQPIERLRSSQSPCFPTILQPFSSTIQCYWSWKSNQWCFFVS
jgi:hypothetical protein